MVEAPEKNLALDIVRITEAAALASARWLGRGDKEAGDGAAVDAMRISFATLHIDGLVIIGEGEKDNAPMLYNGEKVGMGVGPSLDVAVDPVEGTSLLAYGRPNAISVVGVAPKGSMFNPGPSYYMQKLVVAREARNVIDLDAPVKVNLANVAKAMGKSVQDLVVFVLDKPRHEKLIAEIREAGARIQLQTDGDVAGALMAVDPRSEVDIMMGTGGCWPGSTPSPMWKKRPSTRRALTHAKCSPLTIWCAATTVFLPPRAFPAAIFCAASATAPNTP